MEQAQQNVQHRQLPIEETKCSLTPQPPIPTHPYYRLLGDGLVGIAKKGKRKARVSHRSHLNIAPGTSTTEDEYYGHVKACASVNYYAFVIGFFGHVTDHILLPRARLIVFPFCHHLLL
jgi:hypothetical protein